MIDTQTMQNRMASIVANLRLTPAVAYSYESRIVTTTIPKHYSDELDLDTGFRLLCESIASVFKSRQVSRADLLDTLPVARERVFARRYPKLVAGKERSAMRRSKRY